VSTSVMMSAGENDAPGYHENRGSCVGRVRGTGSAEATETRLRPAGLDVKVVCVAAHLESRLERNPAKAHSDR
jgi:hypothetical protein